MLVIAQSNFSKTSVFEKLRTSRKAELYVRYQKFLQPEVVGIFVTYHSFVCKHPSIAVDQLLMDAYKMNDTSSDQREHKFLQDKVLKKFIFLFVPSRYK